MPPLTRRTRRRVAAKVPPERSIFVAYPYRLYAANNLDYRKIFDDLGRAWNVDFVFADSEITSTHILEKIRRYIQATVFGIYDISSWNPNVTLELGLALGLNKQAYIIVDTSKHPENSDVPADLGGIDRIQYSSFSMLSERLLELVSKRFPIPAKSKSTPIADMQKTALELFTDTTTGIAIADIAAVPGVSPALARMTIAPLIGSRIRTEGTRRGTKYFKIALPPGRPRSLKKNRVVKTSAKRSSKTRKS